MTWVGVTYAPATRRAGVVTGWRSRRSQAIAGRRSRACGRTVWRLLGWPLGTARSPVGCVGPWGRRG